MKDAPKVLIVYHYIAHYRKAVFSGLCASDNEISYSIASDIKANNDSLKVLDRDELFSNIRQGERWYILKNFWFFKYFLWQKRLIGKIWRGKFDVVIFLGNMYFLSTWVALIVCKIKNIKSLMWTHGIRSKEYGVKRFVRNNFYRLADGIMLYGNRAKTLLIDEGFSAQSLHVIYNSLDMQSQLRIFNNLSSKDIEGLKNKLNLFDDGVIIATGRLTHDKRFDLLIVALGEILTIGVTAKLILVGDGPEKAKLMSLAERFSLKENIIFYGECYDELEICKLFMLSNVSVVPGDIGLSAIHSLTYGVPVITHNNFDRHKPEFEAIKSGISGEFYEYGSVHSLAQTIIKWLTMTNERPVKQQSQSVVMNYYNPENQVNLINESVYSTLER